MEIRMAWGKLNPVYQDAVQIRKDVFIAEQEIDPQVELDGTDEDKMHYVGYVDDQPVTTARIDMLAGNRVKIQRVATEKAARHHGYAGELIKQIMADAKKSDVSRVELDAQLTAMDFYNELGFKPVGEVFEEAGISHRTMRYTVK